MKTKYIGIGIVLLAIGALVVAYSMGLFGFTAKQVSTVGGVVQGTVYSSRRFALSTVVPGATYEWKITAKNTGNVDWTHHTIVIQLIQDGAFVNPNNWGLQYREDGTWIAPSFSTVPDAYFPLAATPLAAGASKTYYIKMTIPGGLSKTTRLDTILNAKIGTAAYSGVAGQSDTLSIGAVSGELILTIIGALSILGGIGTIGFALFA